MVERLVLAKGTNEFQIWGMSCVYGKKRTDLKDFRKYTEWMEEKRKKNEMEREQRISRVKSSHSEDRKPFRRGGGSPFGPSHRRSSRTDSPGGRNYRPSPSPRDRRSSVSRRPSPSRRRHSPSPPSRRRHSPSPPSRRRHSPSPPPRCYSPSPSPRRRESSKRDSSMMRRGSPIYDSSPRGRDGSSSPYGDRRSSSPPRRGTPEYTSALSSRNRTEPLSYGAPRRSSYSSCRR